MKKEPIEMQPSAARLVESLRDTGYTFSTSVADIVDNSVSADATEIKIILDLDFGNNPRLRIVDNGSGMDENGLIAAMIYGSPLRPNPKSLGKFGMGLKTASTSFARKLTVLSVKDNIYSSRQWDLDKIKETNKWILLEPEINEYEEEVALLNKLRENKNGTIVIWENIDRLVRSNNEGTTKDQLDKIAKELIEHLSGTFFNFLNGTDGYNKIKIEVNSISLEPWDPFCRWLNVERKRVETHINKPFKIEETNNGKDEVIGEFHVNIYILPNKNELTQTELDRMRYGLDNQGFHVFREGRMIYSGGWPNRLFVKEPHLNLIRVELLFDHKLDHYFQIDIKKSRIDLPKDLRDQLKKVLAPARHEANRRYRIGSNNNNNKNSSDVLNEQHSKSSLAIDKHHETTTSGSEVTSVDRTNGETEIKNKFGTTKVKLKFDFENSKLVETKDNLEDGVLWTPGLVDGNKHAVFLNQSHEFYKKFYLANKENTALIIAMDSLLWSLAEAELSVMSTAVKRNLEDMRISVSKSLRTLAEELPEIKEINDTINEED